MLTLFFTMIALLVNSPLAQAERPLYPRDRVYTLGAELEFYNSSENYRTGGTSKSLFSGAQFQNEQLRAMASYEMWKRMRFSTSLSFASTDSNDGATAKSNNGLNEFGLGAQYWLQPGPFFVVPEVLFTYPFWHVDEAADHPLIGEGVTTLEARSYLIWRLAMFQPFGYAGYKYRDSGRSTLLTYAGGAYWRPNPFWVQLAYRGYTSISRDSDDDNRGLRDVFLTRVDGGSYRYHGMNPTLNEAALEGGIRLAKAWNIYAEFTKSINGNDSANGWSAMAGVTYSARLHSSPEDHQDDSGGAAVDEKKFTPQNEKYDESLFMDDKNNGGVKKRVRKTPSVDKLLNETEKELSQPEPEEPPAN